MLKVIIAGSRDFTDYRFFKRRIVKILDTVMKDNGISSYDGITIFQGGARGVDSMAKRFCQENNIKMKEFPAKWDIHGLAAGGIRNREMARNADMLIAFFGGGKGTKNMISQAKKAGIKVYTEYLPRIDSDGKLVKTNAADNMVKYSKEEGMLTSDYRLADNGDLLEQIRSIKDIEKHDRKDRFTK